MKLKSIGEERIVAWIREFLGRPRGVAVGVGDDAAVIKLGDVYLAAASDMIQDSTHIYKGMTPFQIGRKVGVVNFSDLASMGAQPRGFLMSISISQEEEFSKLKDIFRGVEAACQEAGAKYLGGDMNSGDKLVLDGCAFGMLEKREIMKRTGARVGDVVAVTGYVGSAACGWQILQKGFDLDTFDAEERERIEKHVIRPCLEPKARVREGRIMAKSGYVTSCTDISDGLAFSLGYMRDGYGFEIYEDKVPVRKEVDLVCNAFKLDRERMVYHIGEDFELLCTVKPRKFEYLKSKIPGLIEIGKVVEGNQIRLVKQDGASVSLKPAGYDHFEGQPP